MAALEAAGKLDVALKQELEQQLAAMKKFQKVAQGMADGREPGEEELAELNSVMRDVDSTTTGVANLIPHGNQWWRYGYEYLFVQAWLLALLFAVALAVGWPLGRLRASIPAPTRPGLLAHWFNEASYTMAVVAIASAFLQSVVHALPEGLLVRALPAILKLLGARDSNGGELLTPQTTLQIEEMLLAIVTELVAVVIVYYFISYVLVHESEKKKSHWAKLDGELPKWTKARYEERLAARKGGTPRDTHLTQRLGRQLTRRPSLFDRNVEQFECIRDYFVAHLIDPEAPLRKAVARAGGEKALREEKLKQFRLSWYFRMNINECVVILLTISWPTWVFLLVWYLLLGYLAAAWHATYLKCMVIVGLSSVLVLGALVVFSYQRYHMLAQLSDGQGSLAREDIPDQPLHAGVMLWAMRSMTLVLIYGSVQFIGSDFCWKYYPVPIAVFVVVLGAFLVVWCRSWINIVPVYAAAMALPPFHNEGMADHHAEQILASCLDDNEWLEANEKAEKGTEAASLSRDGRVNVADVVAGSGASRIRTAARVAQAAQAFRSRASPAHVAEPAVQAFRSRASPAHVAEPSFPDRAER